MTVLEIKSKIIPILKAHGVKKAGIFGSYVRGESKKRSDIDILVEFEKKRKVGLFDFVGLEMELKKKLGKKVDLVTYRSLHSLLKPKILKEERRIL